jgi:hypothetical protein
MIMNRILPVLLALAALVAGLPGVALAREAVFQPTRFSVTVEGEGPDVILIPGLMTGRRVWDASVRSLGGHYRVHLVQIADLPASRPEEMPRDRSSTAWSRSFISISPPMGCSVRSWSATRSVGCSP